MAVIKLEKQYYATSSFVIGYAPCSSLLAIINKYAITKFNYPGLLTALQYMTSALGVSILGKLGFLYHDAFTLEIAKKFFPAAVVFYLAIFTNTNLLRHANVDTFIVFRSLTPLLVAIGDTTFRKQPCPSKLTFLSLVIILGGAVGYVMDDLGFTLTAYSWAFAYLITITTEMVYIKHMVTNLGLNTWGFVLYNNLLSLMLAPLFWFVTGEYSDVFAAVGSSSGDWFAMDALVAVMLSCVFGLLISLFGFAARKAISATAFTVTGLVNKGGLFIGMENSNDDFKVSDLPLEAPRNVAPIDGDSDEDDDIQTQQAQQTAASRWREQMQSVTGPPSQLDSTTSKQAKSVDGGSDSDNEKQGVSKDSSVRTL
ncbi:GDP-mannose transporter GONST4-like [Asparagus officinalis]|uniref:GDP-mannose transporter GONST4-like n=1 Tax=Asparagus officinalis TaxID=4686 RepID=UPI00098E509F|nr:GDP-mannose transporter GONST4-like [Asparagus officinalis]